ncbi:valine--pyruvate transaminase [Streptomyces hygroscopicus subsp. hygroscopicus]|nr:aminotransferase class I/II-fold pyridoxal phosphate-dependent enzyme [Streptomyces hygroscopicus]GLX50910.1 valine--pyruvate transaminase [Streptomyces hygroscopicus subsp. hygroscopicus]
MELSRAGLEMARLSGLRGIMEDIALATGAAPGRAWRNLGVGNPAAIPEVCGWWQRLATEALTGSFADTSCRYGPSRGLPRLVDAIVGYFNRRYGWTIGPRNVVVGPGSQMLCFMAAAMFTGPGAARDTELVLPMTPDYTGYQGLSMTAGGVRGVEPILRTEGERTFGYRIDLTAVSEQANAGMFLISTPSNPAGRRATPEELDGLLDIAEARDVPLMLDLAYGHPFPGIAEAPTAPIWHERVINSFSLSKTGLPGERLGFVIADERYVTPLVSFLANSALHAPQLAQATLARALEGDAIDAVVASVITPFYAERRKYMEELLVQALPCEVSWRLHRSEGGMFVWLWVDEDWFDDLELCRLLKERGVFVVPGRHFFTEPERGARLGRHPRQCVRISMTPDPADLTAGVERIAAALADMRDRAAGTTGNDN